MTTPANDTTELEALPLSELFAQCEALESGLVREKIAAPAVIDAQRPGGEENPDDTPLAWLQFFAWLHRTHAAGTKRLVSGPTASDQANERVLVDAAMEVAEPVFCTDGVTRFVYPKSYDALRFLDSLDVELQLHAKEWAISRHLAVAQDAAVSALSPRLESLMVRVWAWILTTKGPELPFDEDRPLPSPPKWTKFLAPQDLYGLITAHAKVNNLRLRLIANAFPPDADGAAQSRLSIGGFITAAAAELEPGAARRLLRGTSIGQFMATRVAAARVQREALDRAKAKQDR